MIKKLLTCATHGLESAKIAQKYEKEKRRLRPKGSDARVAVVLHLYYPEMWDTFRRAFVRLGKSVQFDLYITVPDVKKDLVREIDFGDAYIMYVPNRGRDVLPFLQCLEVLVVRRYDYLLKLHSKKSPQRSEGDVWTDELLEKLIPPKKTLLQIIKRIEENDCGMIGPKDNYLPLNVYFTDNKKDIVRILRDGFGSAVASNITEHSESYGFFAGTMFWARLSALSPIVHSGYGIGDFPVESGQLDGTFAHAIERSVCLVCQAAGMQLYESDGRDVSLRPYRATITQAEWDKSADNKADWKAS